MPNTLRSKMHLKSFNKMVSTNLKVGKKKEVLLN